MHKSKKGAVDELFGILVVMVLSIILFFVFIGVMLFDESARDKEIAAAFDGIDSDYNLNYFFSFKTDNIRNVADILNEAFLSNSYAEFETVYRNFFDNLYGPKGLSYSMLVDDKNINYASYTEIITDSRIYLPSINQKVMNIDLFTGKTGTKITE